MRHEIGQLMQTGESLSINSPSAQEYISKFAGLMSSESDSPQATYSCDETGLNCTMLPNKSIVTKEEYCAPDFTMSKEHLTVIACIKAARTHKFPYMVIGKSTKPN